MCLLIKLFKPFIPVNKNKVAHASKVQVIQGWSLIYRKFKSLIITHSNSNRSTCDYWEQRNIGDRGTVGTEGH